MLGRYHRQVEKFVNYYAEQLVKEPSRATRKDSIQAKLKMMQKKNGLDAVQEGPNP